MFCIYQKSYNEPKETIISIIKSTDNFFTIVANIVTEIYKITHTILENTSVDNVRISDKANGHYLICNDNEIILVHKYETNKKGYLYNYVNIETSELYLWKKLSYDIPILTETIEVKPSTIALVKVVAPVESEDIMLAKNIDFIQPNELTYVDKYQFVHNDLENIDTIPSYQYDFDYYKNNCTCELDFDDFDLDSIILTLEMPIGIV